VLQDEAAVAHLVAVELKARLVGEQRLEQHLALDERQPRDVLADEMQKIEGIVDEPRRLSRTSHLPQQ
jgi:hypothetical protein